MSETQSPYLTHGRLRTVYTAPGFVCQSCGHVLRFQDYRHQDIFWDWLEGEYQTGCPDCGGKYEFATVRELYQRDGVQYCGAVHSYAMTADCPRVECSARRCPLTDAMAEKVAGEVA